MAIANRHLKDQDGTQTLSAVQPGEIRFAAEPEDKP